ncbi:helix-turn-helix transcriptional regulator [Herbiconiux sp. L3-i23]|uniref:helix-turn-helix transcriptional regulator n=1 Tax=Herbiconiux sp. L3-i23 TaxID=2905871 RepID=UPI00205CFD49|nr:helix-turn-helix transcriptional regulator [Herbiconiux sp. L3-i23]BDI21390.1 hypothetical protein L3i23_01660 [Herbiconiux sp. L3-i23]
MPASRDSLAAAVESVVASVVAGGIVAPTIDLEAVARSSAEREMTQTAESRAAVVVAASRLGRHPRALNLSDSALAWADEQTALSAGQRALLLSAAAEAHLAAGRLRVGHSLAGRAVAYADRASDDALVLAAGGLLALARALDGRYTDAAESVQTCRRIQSDRGFETGQSAYPLLLAEILIASARLDPRRLRSIAEEIDAVSDEDPWTTTAMGARAMAALCEADAPSAVPLLLSVIGDVKAGETLALVRGFCLGIYADLLLTAGEARRALSLLESVPSPSEHVLCYDMQRAAAHLLLEDPRAALMVTDDCIRMGPKHCLRTTPPILLRRAIAHARLGDPRRSDETFAVAARMLVESESLTPLLTLPADQLEPLLAGLGRSSGEGRVVELDLRRRLSRIPAVDATRSRLPRLTPREEILVRRLRGGAALAGIAADLHVSLNTVKTQLRTVYRKLGVSSREDAVSRLERAGYFD